MSQLEKMVDQGLPFMVVDERSTGAKLLKWFTGDGVRHEHWYFKKTLDRILGTVVEN